MSFVDIIMLSIFQYFIKNIVLRKLQWLVHHALYQRILSLLVVWQLEYCIPLWLCADAGPDLCTLHPDLCTLCLQWVSPTAHYGGGVSPSVHIRHGFTNCSLRWCCFSFHPLDQISHYSSNFHCVVVVIWWWWLFIHNLRIRPISRSRLILHQWHWNKAHDGFSVALCCTSIAAPVPKIC